MCATIVVFLSSDLATTFCCGFESHRGRSRGPAPPPGSKVNSVVRGGILEPRLKNAICKYSCLIFRLTHRPCRRGWRNILLSQFRESAIDARVSGFVQIGKRFAAPRSYAELRECAFSSPYSEDRESFWHGLHDALRDPNTDSQGRAP